MTTIVVDERTDAGKILMAAAQAIRKKSKSVRIFSDEKMEDLLLCKVMQQCETGKYVAEEEVMKVLHR